MEQDQLLLSQPQLEALTDLARGNPLAAVWVERTNLETKNAVEAPTVAVYRPGDQDDVKYLVDRTGAVVRMHPTQGMVAIDPTELS
jgi:hypothetical protein